MPTTRRQVLITISQLATAAALAACTNPKDKSAVAAGVTDLTMLASVAYDVLPYPELPPALYVKAAQEILDSKDASVAAGIKTLRDASQGTAWKDLEPNKRVAILSSLQSSPFLTLIRADTLQVLMRDPAMFALVGYGGSTIEFGGYINRGFNNISWLPASKNN